MMMKLNRPSLWFTGSVTLILLSLGGLSTIAQVHCESPQPVFFVCFFLLLGFWLGWIGMTVSGLCWLFSWFKD
jgi:hypothetical protein